MPAIQAIFIDLGGTLRHLVKDEQHMARARQQIVTLLGVDEDPAAFIARMDERYKVYRKWAFETMKEAPEAELWTRWLVPELPAEKVAPLGPELTYQYRQSMGRREVAPDGRRVVDELRRRGYLLGIISNLIGTREIGEWLDQEGFASVFQSVALSSVLQVRKPDRAIYDHAVRQIGVAPEVCAYIGDNYKRDVTGTRQAGFGMVVLVIPPEELAEDPVPPECQPDVILPEFRSLLDIFPERSQDKEG